jgi:hypothetical protein
MAQHSAAAMIGEKCIFPVFCEFRSVLIAPQAHPLWHDEHLLLPVQLQWAQLWTLQQWLARYGSLLSWIPTLDSHCRNAQPEPRLSPRPRWRPGSRLPKSSLHATAPCCSLAPLLLLPPLHAGLETYAQHGCYSQSSSQSSHSLCVASRYTHGSFGDCSGFASHHFRQWISGPGSTSAYVNQGDGVLDILQAARKVVLEQ